MIAVSTTERNKIHPQKFTMWVALTSIIMMFAGLTSAYLVKSNQANWETVILPNVFWYSTFTILLSSVTIQMALRAFKQKEMSSFRLWIFVTFLLGVVFLSLQWAGFQWLWNHGVQLKGAGAGQFFYVIAGLHGLHIIGGLIAILVQIIRSFLGRKRVYSPVGMEIVSTYWHFVDLLWIYLFIFLHLVK